MGHGFKHGASGAPLNFKIVGGTTEPTNPKENMIWVNTDQKITGWNFRATDPFNFKIASNAGDVVGTAGGITFTKKNDGKSIFAFVRNETFTIPLLVSDSQDAAVLVRSDGEEHEAFAFTYKDKIWYNTYPGLGMDLWDTATPKIENTTDIVTIKEYLVDMLEKAEGMVWISTGAFSTAEFNALKKNGIQVYPLSANQYVNGAWEKKPAKSSRDGAWAEWIVYLYKEGDEYTDVTGGWTASGFTYSGATITAGRNDEGVLKVSVTKSTSKDNVGLIGTAKKIALNGVSAIKIRYTINYIGGSGTSGTGYFGVCDVTDVANKNRAANVALNAAKDVESTAVLDVSSLDGEYYVVVSSWVGTESAAYTHYKVHEITFM